MIRRALPLLLPLLLVGVEADATCRALVGGAAWLPDGRADRAVVVLDGESITAAGPDAAVPAGCEVVDVSGHVVTAGFIDSATHIGLVEIGLEAASVDYTPEAALRPGFAVADAYNPRSTVVPVTRIAGVTSAVVGPGGDGLAAFVDLAGARQAEAVRRRAAAVVIRLGAHQGSRAERLHALTTLLEEAREFGRLEGEWEKNRARPFTHAIRELRALRPVLAGELPLAVGVDRASDIEAVLRLAEAHAVRLIVVGGAEAWLLADTLAARQVPVIVDPMINGPEGFDQLHARGDNAALLARAGVPVILSTFSSHHARKLPRVVGNAIREGLDRDAAVAAVTATPAAVFGMPRHGRLAAGARANVVVWSGDPFEVSTHATHVFIGGRAIPLVSRQTLLRDRYLEDPRGTLVEAPPLPR